VTDPDILQKIRPHISEYFHKMIRPHTIEYFRKLLSFSINS
jgi:hypothetical protein